MVMAKMTSILGNSLKLTFKELMVNKTRTALSLTGVAFGIFCIIGVLATVGSLEQNIQNEVKSLGSNTIYVDKWEYSGGPDKPWWKMRARPAMTYEDAVLLKERTNMVEDIAFLAQTNGSISHADDELKNATVYCVTPAQNKIQPLNFEVGRFINLNEFKQGTNVCVLGFENATSLFGNADRALGKQVELKGKRLTVVGVMKKVGTNFVGWDYDKCIMFSYEMGKKIYSIDKIGTVLIAKGLEKVTPDALMNELRAGMRQVRKLGPREEDNFSLNSVEAFSKAISSSFVTINIVGSIIGGISLIVGMFGIANIMFVTVKERTSIIGLKKAIGAKKRSILLEFLMEAALLCIIGGVIGLFLVWILTLILSGPLEFPVFISPNMVLTTLFICISVGILAGIIPARQAAKLDPVVAIRS